MNFYYQTDKNFVYKGKKYPVDFMILTRFSKFFFNNQEKYNNITDIEISEDGIEISEDEIQNFIDFCQFKQNEVKITHSNIFSLHHLATKYEVPLLIQCTNDYIMNNNKDLILQSLLYNLQLNQPDQTDENFLSSHLFDFIENPEMLKLPIHVLYRILANPKMERISDMNDFHQKQLFYFIFKCLDEHKRPASVLFQIFEVEDINNEVFNRLFIEYKDVFDFNMIKSKTNIKKMSEMMSKISNIDLEFSKYRLDVQCKFDLFQTKFDELTNVINNQKNEINDLKKLQAKFDELTNVINNQKNEINDLKKLQTKFDELTNAINNQKNEINDLKKLTNLQTKFDELTNVINNQKNEINDLKKLTNLQAKSFDNLNNNFVN